MAEVSPSRKRSSTSSAMMTLFCTEIPATAIKPTAADTERFSPASQSAASPPMMVKGSMPITRHASRIDLKAQNSNEKITRTVRGMMTIRRFAARWEFSNWPPHVSS